MTILLFAHLERDVIIVTDTLATTTDLEPLLFQTKAWPVPHLNMAIAMTGVANLGADWSAFLHSSAIARDIADVNTFAQAQLQRIWSELLGTNGAEPAGTPTATIYHFGFEEGSDEPVRYTYRSTTGFAPERVITPGFGMKPEPIGFKFVEPVGGAEWIELAERIRAEQDALPSDERIAIGGELYMLHVANHVFQVMRLHQFADYEDAFASMLRSARVREEQPAQVGGIE